MQTRRTPPEAGGTIDLRLDLDPDALRRAFDHFSRLARDAAKAINRAMQDVARILAKAGAAVREAANDEVLVAGLEGRYSVRAGLDPAYRSPEDLDALVQAIMRGEAEDTRLLTRENRAVVAAAALRGWTHAYPAPLPVLTWHRLIGGVHVVVTRG